MDYVILNSVTIPVDSLFRNINNARQLLGSTANYELRLLSLDTGELLTVGDLVGAIPGMNGLDNQEIEINDVGQIVGHANMCGQSVPFLFSPASITPIGLHPLECNPNAPPLPVAEPSTLWLLLSLPLLLWAQAVTDGRRNALI